MVLKSRLRLIFVLSLWAFGASGQGNKQLIVNFEFGTDYQSLPEHQFSKMKNLEATVVTIRSKKDFENFKLLNVNQYGEILYNIDTHGSKAGPGVPHGLNLSDGDLPITEVVDQVQKGLKKGKKIALLDYSCFSGSDFDLLNKVDQKKLCLVTGDSQNTTAQSFFRGGISRLINDAKEVSPSIEEMFLTSRRNTPVATASPGINTAPGLILREKLAQLQKLMTMDHDVYVAKDALDDLDCAGAPGPVAELSSQVSKILNSFLEMDAAEKELYDLGLKELRLSIEEKMAELAKYQKLLGEDFDMRGFVTYTNEGYDEDYEAIVRAMKMDKSMTNKFYFRMAGFLSPEYDDYHKSIGIGPAVLRLRDYEKKRVKFEKILRAEDKSKYDMSKIFEGGFIGMDRIHLAQSERLLFDRLYKQNVVPEDHACKTIKFKKKKP